MSINVDRIVALAEKVEVTDETEGYTAYAIAKVINDTFKALGLNVEVTSHAIYNDSRNGKIDGVKHVAGEKVRFDEETVTQYAAKFVAKHSNRPTKAVEADTDDEEILHDAEQVEEDLDEEDDGQGTADNSNLS